MSLKLRPIRISENLPRYLFAEREYSIPLALFDAKHKQVEASGGVLTELLSLSLVVTQDGVKVPSNTVTCSLKDTSRPLLGFTINFSASCANQTYNVRLVHPNPIQIDSAGALPGITVTPVLYMLAVQEFNSKEEVFLPDGAELDSDCGKR